MYTFGPPQLNLRNEWNAGLKTPVFLLDHQQTTHPIGGRKCDKRKRKGHNSSNGNVSPSSYLDRYWVLLVE